MKRWIARLARDTRGQDFVEYALLVGFVAVACGAVMPNLAPSFSMMFSRIESVASYAAAVAVGS
jgi:pilus assembly protein Flp/PilA